MPLTLEQYATTYLDGRGLPWPTAPEPDPPRAKPSLKKLPIRAVMWNVYGTLLAIPGGELAFEHSMDFVTDAALDKTIQEFKMWGSMSRKPGAPSAYMKELYTKALAHLRMTGAMPGEKFPEVQSEKVWEDIVRKLMQKDYQIDVATYGAMDEFTKKIAYFFHASIQGTGVYPGAAEALRLVADGGTRQGLLADGQSFTPAQLLRALRKEDSTFDLAATVPADLRVISGEKRAKKPSETLFRAATTALAAKGIDPSEILHVGSSLTRDIGPAKKAGMRTALFAGDKNSLSATPEQLKDPQFRPDVLLTELPQIADVLG